MKKHLPIIISLLCFFMLENLSAQVLKNFSKEEAFKTLAEDREAAIQYAKDKGIPLRRTLSDGSVVELMRVDKSGVLIYYTTDNADAAASSSVQHVRPAGGEFNLTGDEIIVGVWDGGAVRLTHQELAGEVTQTDGATTLSDHATHVTGTITAKGIQGDALGVAYNTTVWSNDWNNDNTEMDAAANNGLLISNHSYGTVNGWDSEGNWNGHPSISTDEDFKFGFYSSDAQIWDQIARDYPNYLIVKSAGNDRNDAGDGSYPDDCNDGTGYDCVSWSGTAKNILTVGAVNDVLTYTDASSVEMSSFSGWGPTDDGRIKPDIVANGVSVYSSSAGGDSEYLYYSGTSMAAPAASGVLALFQEHYKDLNGGTPMKSATLKALAIHTADEAGAGPGPDYSFGWGLINAYKGANVISNTSGGDIIVETSLSNANTYTIDVTSNGVDPLRATICWTDVPGTPVAYSLDPVDLMLVNDLDLRIEELNTGNISLPYILNPAVPSAIATTGDNFRDNVEQIFIETAPAGTYRITVSHKGTLAGGSQNFSLIFSNQEYEIPTVEYCSGTSELVDCSGAFEDGSEDENYLNDQDCSWLISPPSGSPVTLSFSEFDLENSYDFLNVYDGEDASAPLLSSLTGSSLPSPITGSAESMFVSFVTDGSITQGGFSASYTSCVEEYDLEITNVVVERISAGDYLFTASLTNNGNVAIDSSTIEFEVFKTSDPSNKRYNGFLNHHFEDGALLPGETEPIYALYLFCSDFGDLDNDEITVNVYPDLFDLYDETDESIWSSTFLASTLCGGCISDSVVTDCNGTITDGSESFNYDNYKSCSWLIDPPGDGKVSLSFNEFALENGYDFLRIYDGEDASAPLLAELTGFDLPSDIESTGGSIFLSFESDQSVVSEGFSLTYSSCNDVDLAFASALSLIKTGVTDYRTAFDIINNGADIASGYTYRVNFENQNTGFEGGITYSLPDLNPGETFSHVDTIYMCYFKNQVNQDFKFYVELNKSGLTETNTANNYAEIIQALTLECQECDGLVELNDCSGSFQTQGDNPYYNNNQNCEWIINPSGGGPITITFDSLEFAFGDTTWVFDEDDNLLYEYYGSVGDREITIAGNSARVHFKADGFNLAYGFTATYEACNDYDLAVTNVVVNRFSAGDHIITASIFNNGSVPVEFSSIEFEVFKTADPGNKRYISLSDYYFGDGSLLPGETEFIDARYLFCSDFGDLDNDELTINVYPDILNQYDETDESTWSSTYLATNLCGGCVSDSVITECNGTITDGSENYNYDDYKSCSWLIAPEGNGEVTLTFTEFNTELDYDFVRVYDGSDASAPLLATLSGSDLPSPITGTAETMFITFDSDASINASGFSFDYSSDCFTDIDLAFASELSLTKTDVADYRTAFDIINNGSEIASGYTYRINFENLSTGFEGGITYNLPDLNPGETYSHVDTIYMCYFKNQVNQNFRFYVDLNLGGLDETDMTNNHSEVNVVLNLECQECDGLVEFNECSGSFQTQGDNPYYNNSQNCEWIINPSGGGPITITFDSLEFAFGDTTWVFDEDDNLLYEYYGSVGDRQIVIPDNSARVEFKADGGNLAYGFTAEYEACPAPIVDLEATLISVIPDLFDENGIEINFEVTNVGDEPIVNTDIHARYEVFNTRSSETTILAVSQVSVTLEVNETLVFAQYISLCNTELLEEVLNADELSITGTVDPGNNIIEDNEANNSVSTSHQVSDINCDAFALRFDAGEVSTAINSEVKVPVYVSNFTEVRGYQGLLSFDDSRLSFTEVELAEQPQSLTLQYNLTSGNQLDLLAVDFGGGAHSLPDSSILFYVVFESLTTTGLTPIDLTSHIGNWSANTNDGLAVSVANGSVEIVTGVPFSGFITTTNGQYVPTVEIGVTQGGNHAVYAATEGYYDTILALVLTQFDVQKNIDSDLRNGVNVNDVIVLIDHIVRRAEFTRPVSMAASDVNQDQATNINDVIEIIDFILRRQDDFSGQLWEFTHDTTLLSLGDYEITQPLSVDLSSNVPSGFTAIKLGDVNETWDGPLNSQEKTLAELPLVFGHKDVQGRIPVYAPKNLELRGIQLTLEVKGNGVSVEPGVITPMINEFNSETITVLWSDFNQLFKEVSTDDVLFYITNADEVEVSNYPTRALMVNKDMEMFSLTGTALGIGNVEVPNCISVVPNPVVNGLNVKSCGSVLISKVELLAVDGRVLRTYENLTNHLLVSRDDLPVSGSYMVKVTTVNHQVSVTSIIIH